MSAIKDCLEWLNPPVLLPYFGLSIYQGLAADAILVSQRNFCSLASDYDVY